MDKRGAFLIIGIIFWIVAAALMHYLRPLVFDGGVWHILFWIAKFAFGAIAIILIAKLTGRTKHDMLAPVAIMAMPAMLMDGMAVTADAMGATHIYANTPLLAAYSGGFLLFAFWSFFFFALMWHRP
jgi:hypothetical protein